MIYNIIIYYIFIINHSRLAARRLLSLVSCLSPLASLLLPPLLSPQRLSVQRASSVLGPRPSHLSFIYPRDINIEPPQSQIIVYVS